MGRAVSRVAPQESHRKTERGDTGRSIQARGLEAKGVNRRAQSDVSQHEGERERERGEKRGHVSAKGLPLKYRPVVPQTPNRRTPSA